MLTKQKKNQSDMGNRFLITVTVLGSAGPIRFVVNEQDLVATVISTALKSYAREGRIPVLGSNFNQFMLYCPMTGIEALRPDETIGSSGVRNFLLCKSPDVQKLDNNNVKKLSRLSRRGSGNWRAWFNRSLSLKVTHCNQVVS